MKELRELVAIINKHKIKNLNVLDPRNQRKTKVNALYEALHDGKVTTDAEGRAMFTPQAKSLGAFTNLKNRLWNLLINTLFLIDVKKQHSTDQRKAYYELQKELAAVNLLLANDAKGVGLTLLRRILKKAQDYEYNDLVLTVTRLMRLRYIYHGRESQAFQEINELCIRAEDLEQKIVLAEQYHASLYVDYNASGKGKKEKVRLKGLAERYWRDLREDFHQREKYSNHLFRFHVMHVRLFRHTVFNDFSSCVRSCEEEIAHLKNKPFVPDKVLQYYYLHLVGGCLQRGDYERGRRFVEKMKGLDKSGIGNWAQQRKFIFLLAMRAGNYREAYIVYWEVVQHPDFEKLVGHVRLPWIIHRAYLRLLVEEGKLELTSKDPPLEAFKAEHFTDETRRILGKDAGMDLGTVIIRLLFAARERDFDFFAEHTISIRRALTRNQLDQDDGRRAGIFIRYLLLTPTKIQDARRYERQVARMMAKLRENNRANEHPYSTLEVLPFELVWNFI